MGQIKAEGRERGRGGAKGDWAPDPQSRCCRKLSRAVRELGPPTADRDAGWSRPRPQHPHFPTPRSPQRARGAAGSGRRQGAGRGPRAAGSEAPGPICGAQGVVHWAVLSPLAESFPAVSPAPSKSAPQSSSAPVLLPSSPDTGGSRACGLRRGRAGAEPQPARLPREKVVALGSSSPSDSWGVLPSLHAEGGCRKAPPPYPRGPRDSLARRCRAGRCRDGRPRPLSGGVLGGVRS